MRILLVVYDNDSYIHWFPQGLAYIASVLKQCGAQVEVYNQDIHHFPDDHLTRYLDARSFDMICLSVIAGYYQYKKLMDISRAINRSSQRPDYFIIGGHGPSPAPDYFLKKTGADIAVIGEGEATIKELASALSSGASLERVKGIAYREGQQVNITPKRDLIKDIDTISWPAYDLFPIEYYRLLRMPNCRSRDFIMPLLSGRGCTFQCNFCYRMDKGFRPRSPESIIEEIKYLQKEYGISYIAFSDELLMSSRQRTLELCQAFEKANLKIRWDCNGRLNYARPDVLKAMKKAGCVFINYGIEAYDDDVLKKMNKGLTVSQIERGVRNTLESGISPGLNMLFGHIGDTRQTLKKATEFMIRYDDGAQLRTIRPVTPYPGSPLYDYALKKGLIKDIDDFYQNKHLNSDLFAANFTELSEAELYKELALANIRLTDNYYEKKKIKIKNQIHQLYNQKDMGFRGFRQS